MTKEINVQLYVSVYDPMFVKMLNREGDFRDEPAGDGLRQASLQPG
jgi:hypothetical protein